MQAGPCPAAQSKAHTPRPAADSVRQHSTNLCVCVCVCVVGGVGVVCPGNELYIRFMLIEWFCMMLPFVIVLIGLVLDRPCFSSSVVEKL